VVELLKLKVRNAKFIRTGEIKKIKGFLKLFEFTKSAKIQVDLDNNQTIYFTVPAGFNCDSTSFLWFVDKAGDLHDFGYCIQGSKQGFNRKFWDDVYYHLMLDLSFKKWRARYRYLGVRIFGGFAWKNRRKEKYHAKKMYSVAKFITKKEI
jgi:hypothetical protein